MLFTILLVVLSEVVCCAITLSEVGWNSLRGLCGLLQLMTVVADLFLTLKYSNPKNLLEDNDPCDFWVTDLKCDVFFEICVSSDANRDCDLLKKKTEIFLDQDPIELVNDTRIAIPIRSSVPSWLWINIVAWDHDTVSGSDLIGDFEINGSLEYFLQKERSLRPHRRCPSRISMKLELKCRKNWFGKLCDNYCNPGNNFFTCGENGSAICLPGYFGPSCTRKDYCYLEPCAENARCENTGVGFKCICDGREDAKCYASYKPCLNETCSGNGVCKPSPGNADGFECDCKRRWKGKRCEIPLDACELEEKRLQELDAGATVVCLNNGTCVNNPNDVDFHCQCPPEWGGSRCEISTLQRLTIAISSSISAFIVLTAVAIVAICVGKKVAAKKRLLSLGFIYTVNGGKKTMTMPVGENSDDPDGQSVHIYADIGDPYVLPRNDNSTANDTLTP